MKQDIITCIVVGSFLAWMNYIFRSYIHGGSSKTFSKEFDSFTENLLKRKNHEDFADLDLGWGKSANTNYEFDDSVSELKLLKKYPPENLVSQSSSNFINQHMNHIAYIKTHKTASTSISSMFFRHAFKNRIKASFPLVPKNSYLGVPRFGVFDRFEIYPLRGNYRMEGLYDHVIYHPKIKRFLVDDVKFVTSVRDPVEHVKSVFKFFENDRPFIDLPKGDSSAGSDQALNKLLKFYQNPYLPLKKANLTLSQRLENKEYRIQNSQAFDLGYDPKFYLSSQFGKSKYNYKTDSNFYNDDDEEFINHIEENFRYFFVADRLYDSLTMAYLSWNDWDVHDFCLGSFYNQKDKDKDQQDEIDDNSLFTEVIKSNIRKFNHMDTRIHNLAVKKLDLFIEKYGKPRFEKSKNLLIKICTKKINENDCTDVNKESKPIDYRANLNKFYEILVDENVKDALYCQKLKFTPKMWNFWFRAKIFHDDKDISLKKIEEAESNSHKCSRC